MFNNEAWEARDQGSCRSQLYRVALSQLPSVVSSDSIPDSNSLGESLLDVSGILCPPFEVDGWEGPRG